VWGILIFISLTCVKQVWGIYISLLFTSYRFEAGLKNIYVSVICLIRVWGGCEEYLYLLQLPHTGLRPVWGIFMCLLYALYGCEAGVRNIYILFISLIRVWGGSEEYWYLCYLSYTGVRQVWGMFVSLSLPHTGLRWVRGIFISLLFALYRCEAGGSNIYISLIYLIWVWGGSEEYLYLCYLPDTDVRQVWGISISLLFTSYGFKVCLGNIYISFICLIHVRGRWEEYLYLLYLPHTGLKRVWGICISLVFALYRCEAGGRNIYISLI